MLQQKLRKLFRRSPSRNPQTGRRTHRLGVELLESRLAPAVAGTANQNFVAQAYLDQLGRPVDAAGLTYWSGQLDQGASPFQVVRGIQGGPEYRMHEVTLIYQSVFGHAPDPAGLNAFVTFLQSGGRIEQVENLLYGSTEFFLKSGGTNDTFLTALYVSSLKRSTTDSQGHPIDPVDPNGRGIRSDWDQVLASGVSRVEVASLIDDGPEGLPLRINALYNRILHHNADPSALTVFQSLEPVLGLDFFSALLTASPEHLQQIGQTPPTVPGINTTSTALTITWTSSIRTVPYWPRPP